MVSAWLRTLKPDQVHLPPGVSVIPLEAGYLDLYSGEKGIVKSLAFQGFWGISYEILGGLNQDLNNLQVRDDLTLMLKAGIFWGLGASPVCSSF